MSLMGIREVLPYKVNEEKEIPLILMAIQNLKLKNQFKIS